jgi:LCP family protein required for cell wall assembly
MTNTRGPDELGQGGNPLGTTATPPKQRRLGLRTLVVSVASAAFLLGAAVGGAFIYVNHEVGSIQRVPVKFLSGNGAAGTTILLTASQVGPAGLGGTSQSPTGSGLIMLLHINAKKTTGGVVSIPPQTVVNVPGDGEMQLSKVEAVGGPSLLTETVNNLTGLPINHYARIDFNHVASMVNALGGVSVTLPETEESFGHVFPQGVNHVNGTEALDYARQLSLSETGRVLRQESLVRAVLSRMDGEHLLTSPWRMTSELNALPGMLTVDSTFTNSQVLSLATSLGKLSNTTFVTAPTETISRTVIIDPAASGALWWAIKNDLLASFAQQFPDTLTAAAP